MTGRTETRQDRSLSCGDCGHAATLHNDYMGNDYPCRGDSGKCECQSTESDIVIHEQDKRLFRLRSTVERLTKENEELRKFREDVVTVYQEDWSGLTPSENLTESKIIKRYAVYAAAIRERSKR